MKKNPSSGRCFNPRTPCGVRLRSMKPVPRPGRFQSTHSLRSATDCPSFERCIDAVSIHALLAECDLRTKGNYYVITKVSIHALLAECDFFNLYDTIVTRCFNPRTPCGVRRPFQAFNHNPYRFQSTHSLRSATGATPEMRTLYKVSIHALLAECDTTNQNTKLN